LIEEQRSPTTIEPFSQNAFTISARYQERDWWLERQIAETKSKGRREDSEDVHTEEAAPQEYGAWKQHTAMRTRSRTEQKATGERTNALGP
jgi:hypothetical protein